MERQEVLDFIQLSPVLNTLGSEVKTQDAVGTELPRVNRQGYTHPS